MFRRAFINRIAAAGASGLVGVVKAEETKGSANVAYKVTGFTCVTCAIGLEVLIRREKGVARARATYPAGLVSVTFDPDVVTKQVIKDVIVGAGFTAEEQRQL